MKYGPATMATYQPWPRWWRIVLIAVSTLILCSCQATSPTVPPPGLSGPSPALPQQAYTGAPGAYGVPPGPMAGGACPLPAEGVPTGAVGADPTRCAPPGPWSPPGLANDPWPRDEYLADGGDAVPHAQVARDWEIRGLNVEDTIGHFDTVDGRRLVAPSNRVCIYSPRFNSVRQVVSLRQNEQRNPWAGVYQPLKPVGHDEVQIAASSKQQVQLEAQLSRNLPAMYRTKEGDGAMSSAVGPFAFQDRLLPFEAPLAIGQGVLEESEMAFLAHGMNAAVTWSGSQPVQVFIDRQQAAAEVAERQVGEVYTVNQREANPRLRVIKVASTQHANPGDTIDFTIRFDNVGDQVIGNVTIIDNLTTRLEYVPESAQCSVDARFLTEPNEADSQALRWEITDPLPAGEGGIIRFRCLVR